MTYRYFNNETTRSSVLKAVADTANEAVWQRLFDLYAGLVFSIARSKGLNEEEADDVVQDVFIRLAEFLPTFEYSRMKGRFRSYLINLVYNLIIDKWRMHQREDERMRAYKDEVVNMTPADKDFAEREWQEAALEEALRRIKPEVRPEHYAAFVASTVEGQDTETVMRLYNLSRDNLYQIRKRLAAKLRETVPVVLSEMESPDCR